MVDLKFRIRMTCFVSLTSTSLDTSVSKQTDESRIVTAAAYLLFYRRRSEVPLGGPRFQEILEQYNAQHEDEEVMSDSGEGQRLGQGSSQHGSSSALIGAEATHRPKDLGLASDSGLNFGSSSAYRAGGPDGLPAYPSSTADGYAESGSKGTATTSNSIPPLEDAELGPVVKSFRTAELGTVYNSIEDEGIDVDGADSEHQRQAGHGGMTSAVAPTWGWAGVDKGTAQADVEHFADDGIGQEASSDELRNDGHGDDMLLDMSGLTEPGSDYMEPDEPSQPPPLSDAAQVGFEDLQNQIWEHKGQALNGLPVLSVPADVRQDDDASDRVDEIHLKDEDDASTAAKMGEE
jgi:ubiquitin carboxyl-terminal hydrolase 4/11